MEMRDSHPDHSGTLEEYHRDHDRKQQLERVCVIKYVAGSGCGGHKAEQDIPQHQPTVYTTRDAGFGKGDPDLWSRASTSHSLPSFLISDSAGLLEAWNDVPICTQYLMFVWYAAELTPKKVNNTELRRITPSFPFLFVFTMPWIPR
jgi:hypothetical protein